VRIEMIVRMVRKGRSPPVPHRRYRTAIRPGSPDLPGFSDQWIDELRRRGLQPPW
jgi:hypothetical protein